jgi:hypothetical protein
MGGHLVSLVVGLVAVRSLGLYIGGKPSCGTAGGAKPVGFRCDACTVLNVVLWSVYVYVQMLCIHRAPGPTRLSKSTEHLALQGCELSEPVPSPRPMSPTPTPTPHPLPQPTAPLPHPPPPQGQSTRTPEETQGGQPFQLVKLAPAACLNSGGPRKNMYQGKVHHV